MFYFLVILVSFLCVDVSYFASWTHPCLLLLPFYSFACHKWKANSSETKLASHLSTQEVSGGEDGMMRCLLGKCLALLHRGWRMCVGVLVFVPWLWSCIQLYGAPVSILLCLNWVPASEIFKLSNLLSLVSYFSCHRAAKMPPIFLSNLLLLLLVDGCGVHRSGTQTPPRFLAVAVAEGSQGEDQRLLDSCSLCLVSSSSACSCLEVPAPNWKQPSSCALQPIPPGFRIAAVKRQFAVCCCVGETLSSRRGRVFACGYQAASA